MGCKDELNRIERLLLDLMYDYSYKEKAEHECRVHGDKGMCEEYYFTLDEIRERERELEEAIEDLDRCIQRGG